MIIRYSVCQGSFWFKAWVSLVAVCCLCGCDTSVKRRVSATHGMSIEQLAWRERVDSPQKDWGAEDAYRPPPRVATGMLAEDGSPITVSCASCHANMPPHRELASAADLREFHTGLTYYHGVPRREREAHPGTSVDLPCRTPALTCLTCHHSENYNQLRLADGRPIEFYQSRMLCAQCHAPQHRDYLHGAHGGMVGYWDRERGPIERKTCIDCHDPHAPQFPAMQRTFKPFDRFLSSELKGHTKVPYHD